MTTQPPRPFVILRLLAPLALAGVLGCSTLDKGLPELFGVSADEPLVTVQPTIPPGVPSFTVELKAAHKPAASLTVALDRVLHVQDALLKSGAAEHFRRVQVELYRPLENGRYHRLEVRYQRDEQRIDPAFDYEIRPDDRLVITEDTSTIIDDMLEKLSPLGV